MDVGFDHAPDHCLAQTGGAGAPRKLTQWQDAALKIETSNEEFYRFYHQSLEDMAALRATRSGTKSPASTLSASMAKKQVLSVASNPGQCLWSGIVPPDRAARAVPQCGIPQHSYFGAGVLLLADTSQRTRWMRAQDADTDVTTCEVFISICSMNIQIRSYPNRARALLHTFSAVKPYSRITTSPGADAPNRSTPSTSPPSPT